MKAIFLKYNKQLLLFFLWLWVVGLFVIDSMRALPSIAMIGFSVVGLLSAHPKYWWRNYIANKRLCALGLVFAVVLPSVLYSANLDYFAKKVMLLLPYFLLPFAYAQSQGFSPKHKQWLLYTFCIGVIITAVQALVYYYHNTMEVNQAYLESRVMPTAVAHHPTFSLMCALAIYFLYYNVKITTKRSLQIINVLGAAFLIIFIHVFSVRAGLLAFYLLMLLAIYEQLAIYKKVKLVIFMVMLCGSIAVSTCFFSPTIRNKITNTQNDIDNYAEGGSANNQSLGSRIISYKNAIEITSTTSWLFGCGLGDVEDLNNQIFETKYPDITKKIIPHNQFLFFLAAIGILGTLVFSIAFYMPLYKNCKNFNLLAHYVVITVAFLIEAFLLTQLGVAFSLLFLLLFVNNNKQLAS